jgi:hypothetical protein
LRVARSHMWRGHRFCVTRAARPLGGGRNEVAIPRGATGAKFAPLLASEAPYLPAKADPGGGEIGPPVTAPGAPRASG